MNEHVGREGNFLFKFLYKHKLLYINLTYVDSGRKDKLFFWSFQVYNVAYMFDIQDELHD